MQQCSNMYALIWIQRSLFLCRCDGWDVSFLLDTVSSFEGTNGSCFHGPDHPHFPQHVYQVKKIRNHHHILIISEFAHTFFYSFLCHREQLAASILHEGSAGCRVVQKFLKILQVVVQEPGQAFKPFLPSILSLCMEQVYPVVAEVCSFSILILFIEVCKVGAYSSSKVHNKLN